VEEPTLLSDCRTLTIHISSGVYSGKQWLRRKEIQKFWHDGSGGIRTHALERTSALDRSATLPNVNLQQSRSRNPDKHFSVFFFLSAFVEYGAYRLIGRPAGWRNWNSCSISRKTVPREMYLCCLLGCRNRQRIECRITRISYTLTNVVHLTRMHFHQNENPGKIEKFSLSSDCSW
jgi:hypothetical protein